MTTTTDADPNLRLLDPVDGREIVTPKITVDQLQAMLESGAVEERPSWELLDGVVVRVNKAKEGENAMTINPAHVYAVQRLTGLDPQLIPHGGHIRIQTPIALRPFNAPEPDGCIVHGDPMLYATRHPTPSDILCVIEVSDASLDTDRRRKLRLYAEHGLPMYVILNLRNRVAEVHSEPQAETASYARSETLTAGDALRLPTAGDKSVDVAVSDMLPSENRQDSIASC